MKARSHLIVEPVDLNDVARGDGLLFVRSGVGYAGRGIAASVPANDVEEFLRSIEHIDHTGLGVSPVALGVLPFDPRATAELVVPNVVVGKDADGHCWVTVIDNDSGVHDSGVHDSGVHDSGVHDSGVHDSGVHDSGVHDSGTWHSVSQPRPRASSYDIRQVTPLQVYESAVMSARDAARRGDLVKAVIARSIEVTSSEPFDIHAILLRLRASFSQSYRYSMSGFIGASPELLLSIEGDVVRSHPLAGTAPRTGDPVVDEALASDLRSSMKDQIEHRIVIDVIHDQLLPWCSYLDWEAEPSIVTVANVQHLGTLIEGRLTEARPPLMDMVRSLCPTPALGGHPRDTALDLIRTVEGRDRGRYGGAVGWVDARGNGTWAVAIRCAEFSDDRMRALLTAGGGIVAESEIDAELAETQAKFQAMLSALIRP